MMARTRLLMWGVRFSSPKGAILSHAWQEPPCLLLPALQWQEDSLPSDAMGPKSNVVREIR